MNSYDKKINYLFYYWLISCLLIVFLILIVGGLTRLTNSGLSITEWELFSGILPPFNQTSWEFYFNQYKQIPQYRLLNFNMSIEQFKVIFYWEYFHRVLARLIGLFFIIPLIYFYFSKKIEIKYLKICGMIFLLILLQGFMGWYMVKSGLVNDITVSHYRLSIHLSLAVIIISSIFWLIRNIKDATLKKFFNLSADNILYFTLIVLIFFQIIFGAFVSGLDAGRIYQTWPLMGQTYFPNDTELKEIKSFFDFDNRSLVQFYHRNLAYFITAYIILLGINIYIKRRKELFYSFNIIFIFLILQVVLGIITLTSGLNIYLAIGHQFTSVILALSAINLYYLKLK